jgi:hypothetical protein
MNQWRRPDDKHDRDIRPSGMLILNDPIVEKF